MDDSCGPCLSFTASSMGMFVVANGQDKAVFQQIAGRCGMNINLIIRKVTPRIRQPPDPRGVLTIATCLSVENDVVWNVLMDTGFIATTAIAANRATALTLLQGPEGRGAAVM